jgi:hypothetical protein
MTKFRWAYGLRVVVIFLFLFGWALVRAPRADAQAAFPLDTAVSDAAVWLRTYVLPETGTMLFDFSSPTQELSNYCSEKFTADMNAMGIDSVKRIDGGGGITPALGWAIGVEMIVIGSITNFGESRQLDLRIIACADSAVLGHFTAALKMDATLRTLLNYKPAYRPRMTVTVPDSSAVPTPAAPTPAAPAAPTSAVPTSAAPKQAPLPRLSSRGPLPQGLKATAALSSAHIAVIPDTAGITAVRLSYSIQL